MPFQMSTPKKHFPASSGKGEATTETDGKKKKKDDRTPWKPDTRLEASCTTSAPPEAPGSEARAQGHVGLRSLRFRLEFPPWPLPLGVIMIKRPCHLKRVSGRSRGGRSRV